MEVGEYCNNIHHRIEQLLCLCRTHGGTYDFFIPYRQSKEDQGARSICWK